MAHAAPPSALEQGGPIRVEHDRQRRQFSVRLNGTALPLFARARASGRAGGTGRDLRADGSRGGRVPEPRQAPPERARPGSPHLLALLPASGTADGGLPPWIPASRSLVACHPPGCSVASCRPLEEPARAGGITQGTCGLEEEAGRWLRDVSQLTQSVCASVSWNLQWGWL